MGVVLTSTAVANAAPGDCLLLGPEGAKQLVCEPYPPRDPDAPPALSSRCRDLPPIGGLPRRECQQFVTATGALFGPPQTFTYDPPGCSCPAVEMLPAPAPRPAYVPPRELPPLVRPLPPVARPQTPRAPLPAAPVVEAAPVEQAPPAVDVVAEPAPSPVPAAAPRETWLDTVDSAVPWAAGIAALVLVFCLAYRPKRG